MKRFFQQPISAYRDFQIAFTILSLNFAIPSIFYVFAPQLAHQQFQSLNQLLGGAPYGFFEPGSYFWRPRCCGRGARRFRRARLRARRGSERLAYRRAIPGAADRIAVGLARSRDRACAGAANRARGLVPRASCRHRLGRCVTVGRTPRLRGVACRVRLSRSGATRRASAARRREPDF